MPRRGVQAPVRERLPDTTVLNGSSNRMEAIRLNALDDFRIWSGLDSSPIQCAFLSYFAHWFLLANCVASPHAPPTQKFRVSMFALLIIKGVPRTISLPRTERLPRRP